MTQGDLMAEAENVRRKCLGTGSPLVEYKFRYHQSELYYSLNACQTWWNAAFKEQLWGNMVSKKKSLPFEVSLCAVTGTWWHWNWVQLSHHTPGRGLQLSIDSFHSHQAGVPLWVHFKEVPRWKTHIFPTVTSAMNKNLGDLIHVCITPWGNAKFGLRFTVECHAYLFWGLCYLYTPLVILIELHEFFFF